MQKKDTFTADSSALPPVQYRGSVKDLRAHASGTEVIFDYSDRYSVFDWGHMPDEIPHKGEALAVLTDFFYRGLQQQGIRNHALGLVNDRGESLPSCTRTRFWKVQNCARVMPRFSSSGWDYSWYSSEEARASGKMVLVPLEVVFRFGLPTGSSFLSRANLEYCRELGLSSVPSPGERLERVVVEYFTKLEPTDRFLARTEAMQIAGLSESEEAALRNLCGRIANWLKITLAQKGLELWDGKLEFAFTPDRQFVLVDAIGPDELRITSASGVHVSKEILRSFYRGSSWYRALEKAKDLARSRKEKDWKKIAINELHASPEPLPAALLEQVSFLYQALANSLAEHEVFSCPSLPDVLKQLDILLPKGDL